MLTFEKTIIMIQLSPNDLLQLKTRNITPEIVESQVSQLIQGFPFVNLHAPAKIHAGILDLNEEKATQLANYFEANKSKVGISKFVPASGAASRMFKHLFNYLETCEKDPNAALKLLEDQSFNSVSYFLNHLNLFAFYSVLKEVLSENGWVLEELLAEKKYHIVIDYLLNKKGLNYANAPKGLLLFHSTELLPKTSVEEHLMEGACHAANADGSVHLHFTVSPEHEADFVKHINEKIPFYEQKLGVHFHISFSQQKPSTDTVAIDFENQLFREKDGSIHFRPGGHGALIQNLNDLNGDIVFIKNIDNVVSDALRPTTCLYKKAMAGLLLNLREKQHQYLRLLEKADVKEQDSKEICDFITREIQFSLPDEFESYAWEEKRKCLFNVLYRPIRICGMVKNVGEPGGGPFYVKEKSTVSLQIVESSQINLLDTDQKAVFDASTHFNPVDLVCSVRDHNGKCFELNAFTNPDTGFISEKSKDGKSLKALELPGLWNGAMHHWITLFVEAPLITFNPVKTVNDLLREAHIGG